MKNFSSNLLGEKIKYLRKEKGIGQNLLAQELGVSNASISYWETGKQIPSAEVVYKIAIYFGVSTDYLLGIKEE